MLCDVCLCVRCVTVEAGTTCQVCDTRLLTQGFYMFPCLHAFHKDCLMAEVRGMTGSEDRIVWKRKGMTGWGGNSEGYDDDYYYYLRSAWYGKSVCLVPLETTLLTIVCVCVLGGGRYVRS